MKLVTRTHRVLAIIMGIAVLVTIVLQILRDDPRLRLKKNEENIQTITK
jgi:hypothetical protein